MKKTQSFDCNYDFGDLGTFIIEHGANMNITAKSKQRYSLNHHVFEQAEKYHEALKPFETWVIHWTTVDKDSTYYFPESKIVSVLHLYHDKFFHKLKIRTKENEEIVENALPKVIIKRKELFEEPKLKETKKKI